MNASPIARDSPESSARQLRACCKASLLPAAQHQGTARRPGPRSFRPGNRNTGEGCRLVRQFEQEQSRFALLLSRLFAPGKNLSRILLEFGPEFFREGNVFAGGQTFDQ